MTTMDFTGALSPAPEVAAPQSERGPDAPNGTAREVGALPLSRLRRVTDYIDAHLDEDLRLAQLGAVAYMSPFHFARLFQRRTGLPPHRFVVRTRIERARQLLATSDISIAHVSRAVGFRTPSHFSTVFRRVTGVTPRAYRTEQLRPAAALAPAPAPAEGEPDALR